MEWPADERVVHRHDDRGGGAGGRDFFHRHGVRNDIHSGAAPLLGHHHSEEAHFAELFDDLGGEVAGLVELFRLRGDHGARERAHLLEQHFLRFIGFRPAVQHGYSPWAFGARPLKAGFAFVDECAHSFALVVTSEEHSEGLRLAIEFHVESNRFGELVHDLLGARDGGRGLGRDGAREFKYARHEFSRRIDMVHETHREGFVGLKAPAREDEFFGPRPAHRFGEADRRAKAGDDSQADFRLTEDRAITGDDEIAGERHFGSTAEREAVHGRDRGFSHELELLRHFVTELREKHTFFDVLIFHLRDIGAGDESLFPFAGEDHHARIGIRRFDLKRGLELVEGRGIERV